MTLTPIDNAHALQIQAGVLGRKTGHAFEDEITKKLNSLRCLFIANEINSHVISGDPAILLLNYIATKEGLSDISRISALSTGSLATSEEGKKILNIDGQSISRCKSDLVITLENDSKSVTVGISVKQCNNKTPTNAQLYFTTAIGFAKLLIKNDIPVSDHAISALRQFCGDSGFRPEDRPLLITSRLSDKRRFFWEEINQDGRQELERMFSGQQDKISRLLFQKAYLNDPFYPEYILHKTKKSVAWDQTEIAIYTIEELIKLSRAYQGFCTKPYSVKKGSFKDPAGIQHLAPRFGVIQMQRGGQKQHPTQLQFNLEAGYFYKI